MKKNYLLQLLVYIVVVLIFSTCATAQCECENNKEYKRRKSKVSLLDSQKNSTFALQKEMKNLY
jgi:hypothetical protein